MHSIKHNIHQTKYPKNIELYIELDFEKNTLMRVSKVHNALLCYNKGETSKEE